MKKLAGPAFLWMAFTLAGTSVISARLVTDRLRPFQITALSLLFALVFLLPACGRALPAALKGLTLRRALSLALQALFGIVLFRLLLICGLAHTAAGEAGILTGATPAITAVLAAAVLKETPDLKRIAGILGTVSGILLIQGFFSGGGLSADHLAGNLLVLCAAASEAVFNILSRVFALSANGDKPVAPIVQTTIVVLLAFLFALVPALSEPFRPAAVGLTGLLALLWYGAVVTALAFVCWFAGIRRSGALTAAAFSGMMPLTSLLLSALVLGERTGWVRWTGGALVVAGMLLIGSGAPVRRSGGKKTVIAGEGGRADS